MVDVSSSWVCESEGQSLGSEDAVCCLPVVSLLSVTAPVLLSQPEESAPCVLSLNCRSSSVIRRLEFVTEARTVEIYDQSGEYCGTVRGERDTSIDTDSPDSGPFYRKQLVLDHPSASCEVKLLSLCGRRFVRVFSIAVGVEALHSSVSVNHSIDLQQVQSMMEEMGTSLSPGAQHLMDMVQFQQQVRGGALLLLDMNNYKFMKFYTNYHLKGLIFVVSESSESRSPVSPAHITEMMSQLMKGHGQALDSAPDLLPVLQSVCGHVTQLRLDNAAALKEINNGTCECDAEMERRLEQMERRLKEHFDKRLDALEQKLDSVLNLALMNQSYPHLTPKTLTEEKILQATVNCD
uniref:Uncharacterized protein n=1 Tax=Periophthalmus magnuspinnatus TaxID=409849 RepID=A0A3B3Z8V9_9GOBI